MAALPPPPTELDLSPSKARAHASSTAAWSQIHAWLASILSPPSSSTPTSTPAQLPGFEHTPATLAYLQKLMHANLAADRRRSEMHEGWVRQVGVYEELEKEREGDGGMRLLAEVEAGLGKDAREVLGTLAEGAVELGVLPSEGGDVEGEITMALMGLSVEVFELEALLQEVKEVRRGFERQLEVLHAGGGIREHEDETEGNGTNLRQETLQYTTQTKHLALKLAEYQDRTEVLSREPRPAVSLEVVKQRERELQVQRDAVRQLEERLKAYHGLPPDIEASRAEVKRAQSDLDALRRRREELFEEMGRS